MDKNGLIVRYAQEKLRDISAKRFDINVCSDFIDELEGNKEFELDGDVYSFQENFKRNEEDATNDYLLDDAQKAEIITAIYDNLSDEKKEEYLNEMIKHTSKIPYQATTFFEGIIREKEEAEAKRIPAEQGNNENGDNTGSNDGHNENDDVYNNDDINNNSGDNNNSANDENNDQITEENEEKLSFDSDGPAIKTYKEKTEEMEKELEALLKEREERLKNHQNDDIPKKKEPTDDTNPVKDDEVDIKDEIKNALDLDMDYDIKNPSEEEIQKYKKDLEDQKDTLTHAQDNLEFFKRQKERYVSEGRDSFAKDVDTRIREQEELIKNTQRNIEVLEKNISNSEKPSVDNLKFNENKLVEVYKIYNLYDKEIKRAKESLDEFNKIENEYIKQGKGIPFEFHKYKSNLENIINNGLNNLGVLKLQSNVRTDSPEFGSVISGLIEINAINNNIKNIINNKYKQNDEKVDDNVPTNTPEGDIIDGTNHGGDTEDEKSKVDTSDLDSKIEALQGEIGNRKKIQSLYYECLEDIKKLRDLVKQGLDPRSEEASNLITSINNKMSPLPEELKNELTEYLKMALGKKKVEKVEKNPKKTWRTYAALAAGLGIGGLLGFTVGATGFMIANLAMFGAKSVVKHWQKEARDRRINGKKVETIEEPSNKLVAWYRKLKEKALEHEDVLRDINWGLTGGLIGLNAAFIGKSMARSIELQKYVHNAPSTQPTPTTNPSGITTGSTPTPTNTIPGIGEHVNGLEYGYKSSIDAASKMNATHLNQAILNDGKTVVAGYRVGGQTLTSLPAGVTPDAVLLTDGTAQGYRAWAAVEDVVNAAGRSL